MAHGGFCLPAWGGGDATRGPRSLNPGRAQIFLLIPLRTCRTQKGCQREVRADIHSPPLPSPSSEGIPRGLPRVTAEQEARECGAAQPPQGPAGNRRDVLGTCSQPCLRAGGLGGDAAIPEEPCSAGWFAFKGHPPPPLHTPLPFPAHLQNLKAEALKRMTSLIRWHFGKLPAGGSGNARSGQDGCSPPFSPPSIPARHISIQPCPPGAQHRPLPPGPASGWGAPHPPPKKKHIRVQGRGGGVCLGRFSELMLKPLGELVTRTNCRDFPFRPFSPPHLFFFLFFFKGGVSGACCLLVPHLPPASEKKKNEWCSNLIKEGAGCVHIAPLKKSFAGWERWCRSAGAEAAPLPAESSVGGAKDRGPPGLSLPAPAALPVNFFLPSRGSS